MVVAKRFFVPWLVSFFFLGASLLSQPKVTRPITHIPGIHVIEAIGMEKVALEEVAFSEFYSLQAILETKNPAVIEEAQDELITSAARQTKYQAEVIKANQLFPQGVPANYEELTGAQRIFLAHQGAARTLYYLGNLNEIYPSMPKERFESIWKDIERSEAKNGFSHEDTQKIVMEVREKAVLEHVQNVIAPSIPTTRPIIITYGGAHQFGSHASKFPGLDILRKSMPEQPDKSFFEAKAAKPDPSLDIEFIRTPNDENPILNMVAYGKLYNGPDEPSIEQAIEIIYRQNEILKKLDESRVKIPAADIIYILSPQQFLMSHFDVDIESFKDPMVFSLFKLKLQSTIEFTNSELKTEERIENLIYLGLADKVFKPVDALISNGNPTDKDIERAGKLIEEGNSILAGILLVDSKMGKTEYIIQLQERLNTGANEIVRNLMDKNVFKPLRALLSKDSLSQVDFDRAKVIIEAGREYSTTILGEYPIPYSTRLLLDNFKERLSGDELEFDRRKKVQVDQVTGSKEYALMANQTLNFASNPTKQEANGMDLLKSPLFKFPYEPAPTFEESLDPIRPLLRFR